MTRDFIDIIKNNVVNNPNNIAVIDKERKVNYSDFWKLVNSFSCRLNSIKHSPKVLFDLNQSIEAYAMQVAVFNIAGTFCPLYPEAPLDRKSTIVDEFKPDIIVVERKNNIPAYKIGTAILLSIEEIELRNLNEEVTPVYGGEDIVYIIYTSGSTGKPKGVMICRKAVNKFLEWAIPSYGVNETDIWGQFSLLSFDLSIVDILTCLCSGGALLVMRDSAAKLRPSGAIESQKITVWHSIPSAIEFMIKSEESKKYDFSSLRLMSFCGEPLLKQQVDFLFEKNNSLTIFNTYGPTEGTLFCTWQKLTTDNYLAYSHNTMSIGKPIPGWNISLNDVEDSDEKEVIIYGDYIGKGYLEHSEISKFKKLNIEGKEENAFDTGDLITEKHGNLFFSSRKDRQVKIKGHRIELDEIDFFNRELLKKVSVTIVKNNALYSFIESGEEIDESSIRNYLSQKLEPHKIPRAFFSLNEIPRNQNGKINVNSLLEQIP